MASSGPTTGSGPALITSPTCDSLKGRVKKVNSADSIVIWVTGADRAPSDTMVHLANLVAPKVAVYTPDQNQRDEPLGWTARETLRKELVGTEVVCEIEGRTAKSVFAYVYRAVGPDGHGECVNETVVTRGLAQVKDVNKKNEKYDRLKELQDQAKANKVGIWAADKPTTVRQIQWTLDDAGQFAVAHKGRKLRAVIESVHPGAAGVRAFAQISSGNKDEEPIDYYLTVMLAGIRAPPEESQLRPRAIYYIEYGLLHRDVELVIEGAGNNGQLFGRVLHPLYDIVQGLLSSGLAQTQDWSLASMDPEYAAALRAAEQTAKAKRVGLWKNYVEPAKPVATITSGKKTAKVVEVVAADMLYIREGKEEPKKIFLSSIRPPRKEIPAMKENQAKLTMAQRMYQQPLLFQAREFLRTRLVGKTVQVNEDYIQPKSNAFPEKICCTVYVDDQNIAEQLVAAGLATVVRYRQDNDQRSSCYIDLQTAEATAQKNAVGIFAKKEPEPMKVADLQGDVIKSKQYFTSLQRSNPNRGIVEFVFSGSRLRVYCAKHSCVFLFLLNGIQCPRAGRPEANRQPAQREEQFGDEALVFTRDLCLQHEIEIEVEGQDKNGAMIGKVMVNNKNLAVELTKAGLASVHHYSADKTGYYSDLCNAEKYAQEHKLRIWQNYTEPTQEEVVKENTEEVTEDAKSERKLDLKIVVVSEVTPAVSKFFVQYKDDGPRLEELQAKLQNELKNPAISGSATFKRGERAAAKFVDGNWYRVRIEKISRDKADILYTDYGNRAELPLGQLQPLPAGFSGIADFAHPCNLAFVKMPKDEDELANVRKHFCDDVTDVQLKMNVEYKFQGETFVTLFVDDHDIGKALIMDGFAYHEPRRGERYRKICAEYEKAQEEAKRERRNLWEYGDAREDEGDRA